MRGTINCEPFMTLGTTSTANDAANAAVQADTSKFQNVGTMVVSNIDGMSLSQAGGKITINPASNSTIADYTLNYYVSTSYKDAEGNSLGSWYFTVTKAVSSADVASASFDYVTKVMLDTAYDQTAAKRKKYADLAKNGVLYDDVGNEYILVTLDDGIKMAVINSAKALQNWDDGTAATIWCGSDPIYSLAARDSAEQNIGVIKYNAAEIPSGN